MITPGRLEISETPGPTGCVVLPQVDSLLQDVHSQLGSTEEASRR